MTLQPGQTLSHYRLVEKIGEGGMGVVWKAEDTVLGRAVAIKVLPPDTVAGESQHASFLQEAKAAASIGDAHIVGIHEFAHDAGVSFIVMEHVEGRPLNKLIHGRPLPADKMADIGHQVARALSKAHRKGLLHRDIKPSNILVTPEGDAKVVDFGLAALFAPHEVAPTTDFSAVEEARTITREQPAPRRLIAGTLPYMSPEQVRGDKLDARSDIFSLGVVLYEMTTGQRPFESSGRAELAAAIQKAKVVPPHDIVPKVPLELDRLVVKALAAKPQERYQTMEDLAVDLKRLGRDLESGSSPSYEELRPAPARKTRRIARWAAFAGAAGLLMAAGVAVAVRMRPTPKPQETGQVASSTPKMVAVLPFENAGGDPNMEYLSDGLTESIINSLSRLEGLRVTARYTAFQFKGKRPDPAELHAKLGAAAALSGRVLRKEDNLAVTVELIDTADGSLLWAEQYDRRASEIFAVQDEVAAKVASSLGLRLSADERGSLSSPRTRNPLAHDLYLKGRFYLNKWGKDEFQAALKLFNQAIEADPTYALAWLAVGETYYQLSSLSMPAHEAMPKASAAIGKALEIEGSLPQALTLLAIITDRYDWDSDAAEKAYRKAIALGPGDALAHNMYGQHLMFHYRQREAIVELELAAELDPLAPYYAIGPAFALTFARPADRDPLRAIPLLEKAAAAFPDFQNVHLNLGMAFLQTGDFDKALASLEKGAEQGAEEHYLLGWLTYGYAFAGKTAQARQTLEELLRTSGSRAHVSEYYVALAYAALGEEESAFEWLEKAHRSRDEGLMYATVDPAWDSLRDDPRFIDLLRRVGLTP